MTDAQLREQLAAVVREALGREGDLPEGDLADALDSMDRLTLVVAVEDAFGVAFEPEDDAAIRTVDDLVAVLARRLGDA